MALNSATLEEFSVVRIAARRGLHRSCRDHLHEVVHDDVTKGANRVVEVAAIFDPEALGHGDLHAADVVPIPDRLEHRVGESQVEDLLEAHLSEVVIDPDTAAIRPRIDAGRLPVRVLKRDHGRKVSPRRHGRS